MPVTISKAVDRYVLQFRGSPIRFPIPTSRMLHAISGLDDPSKSQASSDTNFAQAPRHREIVLPVAPESMSSETESAHAGFATSQSARHRAQATRPTIAILPRTCRTRREHRALWSIAPGEGKVPAVERSVPSWSLIRLGLEIRPSRRENKVQTLRLPISSPCRRSTSCRVPLASTIFVRHRRSRSPR